MTRAFPEHCRSLPPSDWPVADRAAWDRAVSPGTALLDSGLGASWRPPTRERYRQAYGHVLVFLRHRGLLHEGQAPADRITRDSVALFVESLRERSLAPLTAASYVEALHNAVWAMFPDRNWRWLADIRNHLRRGAAPRPKDPSRLPPIHAVNDAAYRAMEAAEHMMPKRPLQDSTRYRDGLMVAIGAATGLRRKNLAMLALGRHLTRDKQGWRIAFTGSEMKNGDPFEAPLPDTLTPLLDRYVAHHRPRLLKGRSHDALFVRYTGDAFTVNTVSGRMPRVLKRLGFPMTCHDLRTAAATTIAEEHPELVHLVRDLLHHRGHGTGETYYNRARMVLSSRRHGDAIKKLKARLKKLTDDAA